MKFPSAPVPRPRRISKPISDNNKLTDYKPRKIGDAFEAGHVKYNSEQKKNNN